MHARVVAGGAAVISSAVLAASIVDPRAVTDDAPGSLVATQTAAALVAGLVAVAAYARFRVRRRVFDALLALALTLPAAASVCYAVVPLARDGAVSSDAAWAATATRLAAAVLLLAVTRVPAQWVTAIRRPHVHAVALTALATATLAAASAGARHLPRVDLGTPERRVWEAAPALAAVLLVTAAAGAFAAAGFLRRQAAEPDDELFGWIAVASFLAAGADATAAGTFVASYSSDVSAADLLRLLSSVALLAGVAREIARLWRADQAIVVAAERRRIARDLHDGLAQELAYIVSATRRLARGGATDLWDVCWAAESALDESRLAIAALSRDPREPLDVSIIFAAEEVAGRTGTRVTFELEEVEVPSDVREALLRITREAVTNAVRHGAATRVHVRLSTRDGVRLRVSDNGRGFDVSEPRPSGSRGISGMSERAEALGGAVSILPGRPSGTDVEVVLP
ncbi:MAG TPA: sensor histidine kinase [Frankiaceae bacterium]|nr:sensor histidine kinase [Frankiaceae bacterium]